MESEVGREPTAEAETTRSIEAPAADKHGTAVTRTDRPQGLVEVPPVPDGVVLEVGDCVPGSNPRVDGTGAERPPNAGGRARARRARACCRGGESRQLERTAQQPPPLRLVELRPRVDRKRPNDAVRPL